MKCVTFKFALHSIKILMMFDNSEYVKLFNVELNDKYTYNLISKPLESTLYVITDQLGPFTSTYEGVRHVKEPSK